MASKKGQDNLIPQAHVLTIEEQTAGGKASGVSRRNRKRIKEVADVLLALPISKNKLTELEELKAINDDVNTDVITGIAVQLIKKALDGDLRASQLLFTLTGEYSTRYNINADVTQQDKSLERLFEDMGYGFERLTAEEEAAKEQMRKNAALMFEYYCKKSDPNLIARMTGSEVEEALRLFENADDELKVSFVRHCYGTGGKHLTNEEDCIALFDNVYKPKIITGK